MKNLDFNITPSNKAGLRSKESYVVERNRYAFLRILGEDPLWSVMTATASEDSGGISVWPEQLRLAETALKLGTQLNTLPVVEFDWRGREYVQICTLQRVSGETDEQLNQSLVDLVSKFFDLFDGYYPISDRGHNEMRDLYNDLAVDDTGGDVYLGDGVWLSADGSWADRGR